MALSRIKNIVKQAAFPAIAFLLPAIAKAQDTGTQLVNPLGDVYDPRVILGNIIRAALGLIGAVGLLLFLYGGGLIMLSRGDSGDIKKGKNTMLWAVIGMIIIFSSYYLTTFVINKLTGK